MTLTAPSPCDRLQALAHASSNSDCARWRQDLILATCILASSLAFIDSSVVNIGLASITRGLAADASGAQWAVNAYLLPLSTLLLLGGALGDRFGVRSMLIVGILIFVAGSVGCAAAPAMSIFLSARALQGTGAAMLLPASLAVLGTSFQGEARGRAIGVWAAASAMGAALGPALGGWLIDTAGWRSIFLINLPLGAVAIVLAFASISGRVSGAASMPLDVTGAVLATTGLGALTMGLTLASGPMGWSLATVASLVCGLLFGIVFVRAEIAKGDAALLPPALLGSRRFLGLNVLTMLLYGALGGFLVLLPYTLIEAGHYRATTAGAVLLPLPLLIAVSGPMMGRLESLLGSFRLLTLGPIAVAAGLLMTLRFDARHDEWAAILPCVLFVSLGMAAAAAPLTNAILSSIALQYVGSASGLNSALARSGGLVATALLGKVFLAQGDQLITRFHIAMVACAVAALTAAACAIWASAIRTA